GLVVLERVNRLAEAFLRLGGAAGDVLAVDVETLHVVAAAGEADRAEPAADDLAELRVVAHRRRDDDLAALVIIRHDGGAVGHIAAIVLQVDAAGADDAPRVAHAHRRDQG